MTPRRFARALVSIGAAGSLSIGASLRPDAAVEIAPVDRTAWLVDQLAHAPAGATIDVPPGEYHGPFVIDRSLHLRGSDGASIVGNGATHVIAVRAADVVIEAFEVRGSGLDLGNDHAAIHVTGPRVVIRRNRISDSLHGVYVRGANDARIEGNTIVGKSHTLEPVDPFSAAAPGEAELCEVSLDQNRRGNGVHIWNSTGHVITGNVIRHTRDGIYFSFVDRADVRGNDVEGVRYGLHYMYSDDNRFEDNVFRDNAAGAALMYSKGIVLRHNQFAANRSHRAYGILLQSVDETMLVDNRIAGNTIGVFIENGHGNRMLGNIVSGNHVGLHVSDSSDGNTFAGNVFSGNLHTVETSGANDANAWAIDGRGNYWDTAAAIDLDRDGVSDLPHRELDLFGGMRREFPAIGLLAGSPGERLLRLVHARIALPGLAGIVDPAPALGRTRQ